MLEVTYSYCWAIRNHIGRVAPLQLFLPDKNGNLTKEKWFHITDHFGPVMIREAAGPWLEFEPGMGLSGVIFKSAARPIVGDYVRTVFAVEYEFKR